MPPPTPADHRAGPRVEAARASGDMLEQLNPRHPSHPPRGAGRPDRVHRRDESGLQEPLVGGHRQRADLRRVAARRRPTVGLRVPPAGAPGPPERRRPWPLDAEEPPPRDRARRADRGLPRCPARAAPPRPGGALCIGVQPHRHALGDIHRRRPSRATSPRHWTSMLEESVRRIDAFRDDAPRAPDHRRAVRRPDAEPCPRRSPRCTTG